MSLCFLCDLMVSHAGHLPPVNAQQFIAFPESFLAFYSALLKQSGEAATHSIDGPDIRLSGAVWQERNTGLNSPLIHNKFAHWKERREDEKMNENESCWAACGLETLWKQKCNSSAAGPSLPIKNPNAIVESRLHSSIHPHCLSLSFIPSNIISV